MDTVRVLAGVKFLDTVTEECGVLHSPCFAFYLGSGPCRFSLVLVDGESAECFFEFSFFVGIGGLRS